MRDSSPRHPCLNIQPARSADEHLTSVNQPLTIGPPVTVDGLNGSAEGSLPDDIVQSIAQPLLQANVSAYIAAAVAAETRRAYAGDLRDFLEWGGALPSSAQEVAAYIADRATTHSVSTIQRRLVGIRKAHTSQGCVDPTASDLVRAVVRGVRRVHGVPQRQAKPLLVSDLIAIVREKQGLQGLRDRALLLVGFAAALRRSELVGLDVDDVLQVARGMVLRIRRSKTDQTGRGRNVSIPMGGLPVCPVRALNDWLRGAKIHSGPVFRAVSRTGQVAERRLSGQSVSLILRTSIASAGHDCVGFSSHSLRSGLATSAARAGVNLLKIQEQTGHRSLAMLARYIRESNGFDGNAAGAVLGHLA